MSKGSKQPQGYYIGVAPVTFDTFGKPKVHREGLRFAPEFGDAMTHAGNSANFGGKDAAYYEKQGREAAELGLARNPYKYGSWQHASWDDGWYENAAAYHEDEITFGKDPYRINDKVRIEWVRGNPELRDYFQWWQAKQGNEGRSITVFVRGRRNKIDEVIQRRLFKVKASPQFAATDAIHFGRSHATVVIKAPSAQKAYASARAIFGVARVAVGKEYAVSSDKSGDFKITAPYVTTKTTDFSNPIVTTPTVKVAPVATTYPQYLNIPTTQAHLAHQLQLCQAALATAQRQYGSHGVPYAYDGGLSPEERLQRATEALMADAFGGICSQRVRNQVASRKVWTSSNGRWLLIRVRARGNGTAKDLGLQRIKDAGFSSQITSEVKATRKCGDGVRDYIYTVQVKLKAATSTTVVHRRDITPEKAREALKSSSCSTIRQGRVLSGSVRQNNAGTKIYTTVLATSKANAIEQANGRFALTAWADRVAPALRDKTYCTVARGWKVYNMVGKLTKVVQPKTPIVRPFPQTETPQTYTDHIQPQTQEEYNRCAWTQYAQLPEGSMCDPETGMLTSVPGYWQQQQQTQQEQQIADQYGPGWFVDEQGWYYDPSADPNAQTNGFTPQGYTASEQDYYSQGYSQSAPSDAYSSTSYDSAAANNRLEQGIQALMADSFGATINAVFGNDPYSNYF